MCDRGRNAAHAQPKEERSIQMSQKKIEEQQRKILFAHFKAGTLERKMDIAYRGEETAETAKPSEPVEAAKTTETAETTESAKPVRYDYEFDFKYLLGNYYKAYQGDDYYNDMKDGCAEINELEGKTEHDPILLWYIYKKIDENKKSEFTKNANRCILRRGAFMSTMLRISAKYSDSYDKIVEYLATDASLGSMEDVIEQLKALSLDEEAKGFLSKLSEELKI